MKPKIDPNVAIVQIKNLLQEILFQLGIPGVEPVMPRPEYVVGKNCSHRGRPCGRCKQPLRVRCKYVLHPHSRAADGRLEAYHAVCWQQTEAATRKVKQS